MLKLSLVLVAAGLALLALSFAPGPAAPASLAVATTPAQPSVVAAPTPDDAAYGRALFSAKGCVTCHHHAAVPGSGPMSGPDVPDLSRPSWEADYLRAWLKDPGAVRKNTPMPNMGLKQDEIEALVAFLTKVV